MNIQPTWQPVDGSGAALIHEISLTLYIGCALIFVFVMALLFRAVFTGPRDIRARRWLTVGGLIFPGVVLSLLLVYSLAVSSALANFNGQGLFRFLLDCVSGSSRALATPAQTPLRVEVTGEQWWWRVRYVADDAEFELANEIRLPVGRPVDVVLTTADVIHSFWVPSLAGKVDMIPGHVNRIRLKADIAGEYGGICAEYCGGQHALMGIVVVAEPEPDFERWRMRQAQPAAVPTDEFLALGRDAFMRARCGSCHTVRGTGADGADGPDLTHIGSRGTLGAAILDNHIGTLGGWIAGTQDLKPGSHMPNTRTLTGRELRALSAWLESLR